MSSARNPENHQIPKSLEMYQRALELIPGGTQLISRRPTRFAHGISPIFASHGKGARIWDVDGNEYIDWVSGIGAILLGYADPVVDDAVKSQIDRGTNFSITHELELELAEELVATIPCAEMVRYTRSGGEACAVAVRIARGVTGRDKVLFCGYHGWHDWYIASNLTAEESLNEHLFSGIEPIGVPSGLKQTAIPFPYDDLNALGELLDANRGEVAAIIMEPIRSELPPEGYLAGVQKLAKEHDVVLIFDEVTTGFRLAVDGIQSVVGVEPDMSVFAKSISNGYAMGAVVGKRDVMSPSSQMFISSTYWGETVGLTAALTTIREVKKRNVPAIVQHTGTQLISQLTAIASEIGLPVVCKGVSIHPYLEFQVEDAETKTKLSTLYIQEMAKRGCHGYTSFYLNAAQGEAELSQTWDAARETFTILAAGLADNRLDDLLECIPKKEYFQRLVR
ncbi:MAG: aminotransferase class III-fold pyridoxal phosphate-dependent enzyme [Planctomycetaceae bacterium]|nr:aminotransferase class III-fold pyridoxal phosphate-dependent enzyme [Planctomycetaceae bacterium]